MEDASHFITIMKGHKKYSIIPLKRQWGSDDEKYLKKSKKGVDKWKT